MVISALTPAYIAERWPRPYHMTEQGSWNSIQRHGLRSTTALLDLLEIYGAERASIESARRPESVKIRHPVHGVAWIRDYNCHRHYTAVGGPPASRANNLTRTDI